MRVSKSRYHIQKLRKWKTGYKPGFVVSWPWVVASESRANVESRSTRPETSYYAPVNDLLYCIVMR